MTARDQFLDQADDLVAGAVRLEDTSVAGLSAGMFGRVRRVADPEPLLSVEFDEPLDLSEADRAASRIAPSLAAWIESPNGPS